MIAGLLGSLPSKTNQETWDQSIFLYDDEIGPTEYIDLTDCVVTLTVADENRYSVLTGSSLDGHIALTNPGFITLNFTPLEMSKLSGQTYDVGIRVTANSITRGLFNGTIAILEGVDRQ